VKLSEKSKLVKSNQSRLCSGRIQLVREMIRNWEKMLWLVGLRADASLRLEDVAQTADSSAGHPDQKICSIDGRVQCLTMPAIYGAV
jgi:hypothetical protein